MKPVAVFAAGALVGALVAALLVRPPAPGRKGANIWRERAEQIQVDLATAQNQRDALADQLRKLTERFTQLSERFDTLSATVAAAAPTAAVTPAASARPAARAP